MKVVLLYAEDLTPPAASDDTVSWFILGLILFFGFLVAVHSPDNKRK